MYRNEWKKWVGSTGSVLLAFERMTVLGAV
jgi:hypothetical protein